MLNIISWNVNGLRAALSKGFANWFNTADADIVCLQEAKALPEQVDLTWLPSPYHHFWNPADKKGYSGVVTLSKYKPVAVLKGMGLDEFDAEGRLLTLEFESHYLVNVYTPNSQNALRRLPYRCEWDQAFLNFLLKLGQKKPVIFCGDLNVAHTELDIKNAKSNWNKNPGYTEQECSGFTSLLDAGFVDSFRHLHPGEPGHYSWWSYRANARANNVGWRIDYIGVQECLLPALRSAKIHSEVQGSDHCPVSVELDL